MQTALSVVDTRVVSVELFKVQKYAKKRKVKVTAKPKVLENVKRSCKKSWNLKSSKEYEACVLSSTVGSASPCPSIIPF